jgi:hypothetical protein
MGKESEDILQRQKDKTAQGAKRMKAIHHVYGYRQQIVRAIRELGSAAETFFTK